MRTHILGFPSMGRQREMKQALESFWRGDTSAQDLTGTAHQLQESHWAIQREAGLSYVTTGDFSLYDRMLDTSLMLGAVPARFARCGKDALTRYFALARGDASRNIPAMEMTKWFDTNYHYLVPEIEADAVWTPGEHPVLEATRRAAAKGFINATDCADYLTKKGMPFRDAYKLTGCMVSDCISKDKTLEELTLDEFKGYSALFENDIYDAIDLIKCCEGRTSYGGPSEASVKKQIELASAQLGAWEAANA